jgi:hypothetical protein
MCFGYFTGFRIAQILIDLVKTMVKKMKRIFAIVLLLNAFPVFASQQTTLSSLNDVAAATSSTQFKKDPFPLKNTKTYDEANDPAFRRCGTNSQGPQHGYFAVPFLVLGLAGVLLYFSKSG